jgi:energy-coupling factor transporter transmembrane protein EcfT
MVGSLFLRSVERSERLSVAMQARGFTGLLPPPPPRPLSRRNGLILGALLLAQALLLAVT